MSKDDRPTVYSTEAGDLRKQDRPARRTASPPPEQQKAYLHRESKGRGGKTVTVIKGLQLSEPEMKALAKRLKKACGSGGTVKDGVIEIQGEHREKIAAALEQLGYRTVVAGG